MDTQLYLRLSWLIRSTRSSAAWSRAGSNSIRSWKSASERASSSAWIETDSASSAISCAVPSILASFASALAAWLSRSLAVNCPPLGV